MHVATPSMSPGKVLTYRSAKTHRDTTAWLAMIIFLGSWGMLFGALFFVYGALRSSAEVWPPMEYPELPLGLPTLNTIVVALSSLSLHWGVKSLREGRSARLGPALLLAAILGTVFLVSQIMVWDTMNANGLSPASGGYGSTFFGLTWLHAAHVVVGVGALYYLTIKAFQGYFKPASYLSVRLWSMYWHFVGVMWALMFLTVYIL